MRLHRMISILLLLEEKGKVKAGDLAEKLETSVRTIYRDIDALCEAGIPIKTETGPKGGIQFMDGYKVNIKDLNKEDIINLYLSSMGVKPDQTSEGGMKVTTALLKLQKVLSPELNGDLDTLKRRFYVDDMPWWGKKQKMDYADMFMQAIWQSYKLRITYEKPGGEVTERNIRPYGIVVNQMDWYMIAYCEKSHDLRTFKCERIKRCVCLFEKFTLPHNFSAKEYWESSKKLFKETCMENDKYPVILKVDKKHLDLLKEFPVYEIKEVDHAYEVTLNLYHYERAKREILKMTGYAEVIRPEKLRNDLIEELKQIIKKYNINNYH